MCSRLNRCDLAMSGQSYKCTANYLRGNYDSASDEELVRSTLVRKPIYIYSIRLVRIRYDNMQMTCESSIIN